MRISDWSADVCSSDLSMLLPAFRGIEAVRGVEGLVNPRGFILADKHQRNPNFKNVYSLGVCVAIPPVGPTPVPVGVPKTGFMKIGRASCRDRVSQSV